MSYSPFTLRSDDDLLATFRRKDAEKVILPQYLAYPVAIQHYFAWSEPSGAYTYLVYKDASWERPVGIALQRNGSGRVDSPAGMCDWCHHCGPSDEVGLLTTAIDSQHTGGTWLCLDLSCIEKALSQSKYGTKTAARVENQIKKICDRIGQFCDRVLK